MDGDPRLLCDEMLHGLARWLRAAGYDAACVPRGLRDREVLARARREDRLLVTRDRRLLEHRAAAGRVLLLAGNGLEAGARELRLILGIDWLRAPFSRCLVDNAVLRHAGPEDHNRVPGEAGAGPGMIYRCPACARLYWPGSHVRRMRRVLERWRELA